MTSYHLAIKPRYLGNHASQIKSYYKNPTRKSWSLFQNASLKVACSAPLANKLLWHHIRLAIKPRYLGNHASQIKSYYRTLSGSHGWSFRICHKNQLKRLLADKSRWRHIRQAIKPRYLGNHASEIKSYYWSLSGSHGRTFRIRHEKSREAPLAENSWWRHIRLAIKPRYLENHASEKKSYWKILSGSDGRFIICRHENKPEAPPSGEFTTTSYPPCNKTSLSGKPCIPDKKLMWNTISKSRSHFLNLSWKFALSPPEFQVKVSELKFQN